MDLHTDTNFSQLYIRHRYTLLLIENPQLYTSSEQFSNLRQWRILIFVDSSWIPRLLQKRENTFWGIYNIWCGLSYHALVFDKLSRQPLPIPLSSNNLTPPSKTIIYLKITTKQKTHSIKCFFIGCARVHGLLLTNWAWASCAKLLGPLSLRLAHGFGPWSKSISVAASQAASAVYDFH